jgi:hypothetical protein
MNSTNSEPQAQAAEGLALLARLAFEREAHAGVLRCDLREELAQVALDRLGVGRLLVHVRGDVDHAPLRSIRRI